MAYKQFMPHHVHSGESVDEYLADLLHCLSEYQNGVWLVLLSHSWHTM